MRRLSFIIILIGILGQQVALAKGSSSEGEKAYVAKGCIGCHGPAGKSPNPSVFPSLQGKKVAYIKSALHDFRSQKRNNPMMSPMAAGLSDEDIDNLSAYLGVKAE